MIEQSHGETESRRATADTPTDGGYTLDLLDIVFSLVSHKHMIFWVTFAMGMLGLAIALIIPPYYTATAVIMTPQQDQSSASALIGQLGALGSLGGAASSLGLKSPADLYVGILGSRTIADDLIERFHLQSLYKVKLRVDARHKLTTQSTFEAGKDGLIYIRVKTHNPNLSASLANGYVDELYQTNSRLAIGQAAQRRMFYDQQLQNEKTLLAKAEDALKQTEEKTGVVQLTGQTEMTIRNIATTRAMIASMQVQLDAAKTYETAESGDVQRMEQEIDTLNKQLANLQDAATRQQPGDVEVPAGRVPAVSLEYLRKFREVRYHETLFELLAKQAEAASLDEAKSAPLIQVVDHAEVPERKSGPSRILITLGLAFFGLLCSTSWAIGRNMLGQMKVQPGTGQRLAMLKETWRAGSGGMAAKDAKG